MKLEVGRKFFIIFLVTSFSFLGIVIAAEWSNPTPLVSLEGDEMFPAFSPDGSKIAFVEYATGNESVFEGVFIVDLETNEQKIVLAPDELFKICSSTGVKDFSSMEIWRLSWSPDGSKILFSAYCLMPNYDKVVRFGLINLTTLEVKDLKAGDHPSWSSDGRKIVYLYKHSPTVAGCQRCGKELWIMNVDGSDDYMIFNVYGDQTLSAVPECEIIVNDTIVWPSFSPDGSKILFGIYHSPDNSSINLINVDGTGFKELISGSDYSNPQFTPDGKEIVFFKSQDDKVEIWSILADGSNLKQLSSDGVKLNGLSISPDGKKLIFPMSNPGSGFDIWVMTKEIPAKEVETSEEIKLSLYVIVLIIAVVMSVILISKVKRKK